MAKAIVSKGEPKVRTKTNSGNGTKNLSTYIPAGFVGSQDNLNKLFSLATTQEKNDGLAWYATAAQETAELATRANLPVPVVAGIVALLSPNRHWAMNIRDAGKVIDAWQAGQDLLKVKGIAKPTGNGPFRKCAEWLAIWAREGRADLAFWQGVINGLNPNGLKVPSFFNNLACPDSDMVTVDGHAIAAWIGHQSQGTFAFTTKTYKLASADYKAMARHHGIEPRQAQAIVWVVRRRLYGKFNA